MLPVVVNLMFSVCSCCVCCSLLYARCLLVLVDVRCVPFVVDYWLVVVVRVCGLFVLVCCLCCLLFVRCC